MRTLITLIIAGIMLLGCKKSKFDSHPNSPVAIIHFHFYQDENIPYQGAMAMVRAIITTHP